MECRILQESSHERITGDEAVPTSSERSFGLTLPGSSLPAIPHLDYSVRIRTVHHETNPKYHAILSLFKARTSYPVLVNTSFNVRGEPIVCTPEDAYRCFMGTDIEILAIGNCLLRKEEQDSSRNLDYKNAFELD